MFVRKSPHQRVRKLFEILLKSKIRHQSVVTAGQFSSLFIVILQGLQMAVMSVCRTWGGGDVHQLNTNKTGRTTVFVHSLYWKFFTCESSEPAHTPSFRDYKYIYKKGSVKRLLQFLREQRKHLQSGLNLRRAVTSLFVECQTITIIVNHVRSKTK